MTERLYYNDAYLADFDAQVLACEPNGEHFDVLLDRSAFYPTSGGQPYDTGLLGDAKVIDVNVKDGDVWHTVTDLLTVGETVHGHIDWERRFDHMQQHAGDHMIAGALHRLMGGVTIGLHVSDEVSTIDVAMPEGATHLSDEEIRKIEWDVNSQIQRNVPIRCWFPSDEELEQLPLRKKPTVSEHVRIVAIGENEMVACGGTHPSTAGQIGLVKIVSATPARGKMRVAFLAGQRAFMDYQKCHAQAHAAAELLSSKVDDLASSVEAAQERLHAAEMECQRLKRMQLLAQAEGFMEEAQIRPDGTKLVARFVEANANMLRDLVCELIRQPGVIALMGAMNGKQALYAFGRSADVNIHMGELMKNSAVPMGGKGGGRPDLAQGGGCPEILQAACCLLRGM